jgi:dihydrofolate reductase
MRDGGEFKNLENIRVLVVFENVNFQTIANNHSVAKTPKDALAILEKEGFNNTLVAGGGTLNTSFMAENLIDEIYLDVEPIVFGKGIRLFRENDFEAKLKLFGTKKLSENEIQLHYQVLK